MNTVINQRPSYETLIQQGRYADAIAVLEFIVLFQPEEIPAYIQLGRLNYQMGQIGKAREWLMMGLTQLPTLAQRREIEALLVRPA